MTKFSRLKKADAGSVDTLLSNIQGTKAFQSALFTNSDSFGVTLTMSEGFPSDTITIYPSDVHKDTGVYDLVDYQFYGKGGQTFNNLSLSDVINYLNAYQKVM